MTISLPASSSTSLRFQGLTIRDSLNKNCDGDVEFILTSKDPVGKRQMRSLFPYPARADEVVYQSVKEGKMFYKTWKTPKISHLTNKLLNKGKLPLDVEFKEAVTEAIQQGPLSDLLKKRLLAVLENPLKTSYPVIYTKEVGIEGPISFTYDESGKLVKHEFGMNDSDGIEQDPDFDPQNFSKVPQERLVLDPEKILWDDNKGERLYRKFLAATGDDFHLMSMSINERAEVRFSYIPKQIAIQMQDTEWGGRKRTLKLFPELLKSK